MEEVLHQLVDVLSPKYNPMRFTIHRPKVTLPGAGFRKIIRQFHRCQSRTQYTRQRADSALRQEAIGIASHQDFPHRLKPGLLRGSMLTCFFVYPLSIPNSSGILLIVSTAVVLEVSQRSPVKIRAFSTSNEMEPCDERYETFETLFG